MPRSLALRDVAILLLTLAAWRLDAALRGDGGALAAAAALVAGTLAAVCGYLAHEWGHFVGARLGGAVVHPARRVGSLFLFQLDTDRSGRAAFLAMSLGGFAASAAVIVLLVLALPLAALSGRVALALAGLGVVATFVLEVPVAWRVARGAPLPRGVVYRSGGGAAPA